ncbi:hypothetical protein DFH09DRAFT_1453431 [Mycena vulgaris]|nr:hypothetical protein DFH09DRAFT_1454207 [Mycena vulgaris]KAJ6491501.1 hypothetical protein DFH09DRAFT_1453431 [Mycena vulgaris]
MLFSIPSRARLKPGRPTAKFKLKPKLLFAQTSGTLPDVLWTSMLALKESANAFPPLKAVVGGVIALWDIAERAKHSKSDARAIALRTKEILDVVADAVPDGSAISPAMLFSIKCFTSVLAEIKCSMEAIALTGGVSRGMHLNRNERELQRIKAQLDDAYRDFVAASVLRLEVQHAALAMQHAETHLEVKKYSLTTETLAPDLARLLLYARFTFFLAGP